MLCVACVLLAHSWTRSHWRCGTTQASAIPRRSRSDYMHSPSPHHRHIPQCTWRNPVRLLAEIIRVGRFLQFATDLICDFFEMVEQLPPPPPPCDDSVSQEPTTTHGAHVPRQSTTTPTPRASSAAAASTPTFFSHPRPHSFRIHPWGFDCSCALSDREPSRSQLRAVGSVGSRSSAGTAASRRRSRPRCTSQAASPVKLPRSTEVGVFCRLIAASWVFSGPAVAICCEYDALPGIGHACGHNLIAEATLANALH